MVGSRQFVSETCLAGKRLESVGRDEWQLQGRRSSMQERVSYGKARHPNLRHLNLTGS